MTMYLILKLAVLLYQCVLAVDSFQCLISFLKYEVTIDLYVNFRHSRDKEHSFDETLTILIKLTFYKKVCKPDKFIYNPGTYN